MYRNFSSDDSNILGGAIELTDSQIMDNEIKEQIEFLRKEGYSEDDILLMLIEERCNPNHNSFKNVSNQKEKTKKYVYISDIFSK